MNLTKKIHDFVWERDFLKNPHSKKGFIIHDLIQKGPTFYKFAIIFFNSEARLLNIYIYVL